MDKNGKGKAGLMMMLRPLEVQPVHYRLLDFTKSKIVVEDLDLQLYVQEI